MVEALSLRRDTSRRGGFTLLEVVIALAIFVIGALAIIRIFPPALGVIQNSGDRLTAVNLNRSVLARYAREPGLVPDGIYDDPNATNWRDNRVGSVAGAARRNNSIPFAAISGGADSSGFVADLENSYNFSALGHFKNIKSERHIVPANGVVVTQFPYQTQPPAVAPPAIPLPVIPPRFFIEDSVSKVTLTSAGALDFTQSVQASTGVPYVPNANDYLYVSYNYIEGGQRWGVQEEPIQASATPVVAQSTRLMTPVQIVTDELTVRLRRAATPVPTVSQADGNIGIVNLASFAGQTISIDYQVKDWRWLVFDGIPTDNPKNTATVNTQKSINLPVKILDDQKFPSFVYTSLRSATIAPDNRESATPGGSLPVDNFSQPNLRETRNGRIVFDTSMYASETPQARVVYWTADNWASQLSVAARSYLLNYGTASIEPWRDCAFDGANRSFLYFKPSEAGKTVSVSYSYTDTSVTPAVERNINGRIVTIDNTLIDTPLANPAATLAVGGNLSRLQFTDINGNPVAVSSIREIRGISIQARTAWIDGNNFTQTSSIGFREVNN